MGTSDREAEAKECEKGEEGRREGEDRISKVDGSLTLGLASCKISRDKRGTASLV